MKHIVILAHQQDSFETTGYFLHAIAEIWREEGLRVTVLHGPGTHIDADLAILHVDLTVVPSDYLAFIRRYPLVLNGGVVDISKRRISKNSVSRKDAYRGPVILKTNNNYGGGRESALARNGPLIPKYAHLLRQKLPWSLRSKLPLYDYRIFDSVSQVPLMAWYNRALVVERFIPERRDGYYCLRTWFFLGDQETNSLSYSNEPIIKSDTVLRREPVAEVPEELRQMRRDLGFDYGKFDYAIVDGRAILYDANRTPTLGSLNRKEFLPSIRLLAKGIGKFIA